MKRLFVVVLTALVLLSGCNLKLNLMPIDQARSDPERYLARAFEKTKTILAGAVEASPFGILSEAVRSGSVSLAADMDGTGVENTVFFDAGQNHCADILTVKNPDGSSSEIRLHSRNGEICVLAPDILGEAALGLNAATLREDLKGSALLELLGFSYEDAMAYLGNVPEVLEKPGESSAFVKAKELWAGIREITKNCSLEIEEKSVLSGGGVSPAIQFRYAMTSGQLADAVRLAAEYALAQLPKALTSELSANAIAEEIRNSGASVLLTLAVSPAEGTLYYAEAEISAGEGEEARSATISLDLGPSVADSESWEIRVTDPDGTVSRITISRVENDTNYTRRVTVSAVEGNRETSMYAELDLRKADGVLTAAVHNGETVVKARGSYVLAPDTVMFELNTLEQGGQKTDASIRLSISGKADCPEMPEYTNVILADRETLQSILDAGSALNQAGE